MFLIEGVIAGLIATLFFDLYQNLLLYAYNINKSKWNLVGRYFATLKINSIHRNNISDEEEVDYELIFGYFIHYLIGSFFGIIYVSVNLLFYDHPSIFLALFVGLITVLGGWCFMMPYVFNIGYFASKIVDPSKLLVQNLIAHFIFGVGLYIGYLLIL